MFFLQNGSIFRSITWGTYTYNRIQPPNLPQALWQFGSPPAFSAENCPHAGAHFSPRLFCQLVCAVFLQLPHLYTEARKRPEAFEIAAC